MDAMHGVIIVAADCHGPASDGFAWRSVLAPLRRLCGIQPGSTVVLTAAITAQVLVIHPATVMAELLAAHYTDLIDAAP
jgi:hypothetical protein